MQIKQNSQATQRVQGVKTPQVSIIVPIYNVASYLKECLQSIVKQSYENLDIILVDDGSSDESLNIALEFAENDERIFVISKPNGGLSSARNTGLEFIKGSALRGFFENRDTSVVSLPQYDNATCQTNSLSCHTERSETSQYDKNKDIKTLTQTHNFDKTIQSLIQTHSFTKTYKDILAQDIQAHFTQIEPNFIKSDLERINDFITQELPQNTLIHFVDSDDYITQDCIEKCVQNLLEKDLDILVHNLQEFDENTKEFKNGSYLNKLKQDEYHSGLELLAQNKIYDFYFSPQGLFTASVLNRYALRYTEGIYHEDHDFGTLLFCLAHKVAYIKEALYIYRARAGSITTAQKNTNFPKKLPSFLEPLRKDFKDYKALRAYFKSYCFVRVGFGIWEFYTQKSAKDEEFKRGYKNFFYQITLSYMKIFKSPLTPDIMGIKALLRKMSFDKCLVWREFFKDLHRQPKKIRYITNIKYLLTKDK